MGLIIERSAHISLQKRQFHDKNSSTPKKKKGEKTTVATQINRNNLFLQLYSQLVLGRLLRGYVKGFRILAWRNGFD